MRVSEIRVKQIRVNQGLGVHLIQKSDNLLPSKTLIKSFCSCPQLQKPRKLAYLILYRDHCQLLFSKVYVF